VQTLDRRGRSGRQPAKLVDVGVDDLGRGAQRLGVLFRARALEKLVRLLLERVGEPKLRLLDGEGVVVGLVVGAAAAAATGEGDSR
jgi:hypothetical protein